MNGNTKSPNRMNSSFFPIAMTNNAPKNSVAASTNVVANAAANASSAIANITQNVKENVINTANSITEPIKNSFMLAKENTEEPFVSITIIVVLGICVVLFILVILFKDQIVLALELLWFQLKKLFGFAPSPPDENKEQDEQKEHKEHKKHDNIAINQMIPGKQVFNVSQNKYKYSDAEPLCKAFGAELATYDQVKDAWQKGADWCNYGWVKGQSAIFPTQQSTYDKLQAGPEEQRGVCGVPGINGGYFDNPDMRFGVNCYGTKPSENDADIRSRMSQPNFTSDTIEYNRKVSDFKAHMTEIPVNPFAEGVWSN